MSFLADIIVALISKLALWIESAGLAWWKKHEQVVAIEEQGNQDAKNIQSAKTPTEKSDALQKTIDDTFGGGTPQ